MTSSPSRNPAFVVVALLALGTAFASHQRDPVKTMAVEKIEARYMSDRTACLALQGDERKECKEWADVRQKVSLNELNRLMQESDGLAPPDNVALGTAPSPS